jgi:hypothetical protein
MDFIRTAKLIYCLVVLATSVFLWSGDALAQCTGQFASGSVCGNATGSQATPRGITESTLFDFLYGTSPGTIIYRGPSGWTSLTGNNSGTQVLTENASGVPSWQAAAGTGTVTSVGLSLPNVFTVTVSPITTSGSLTAVFASQTQNLIFASPNGSSGVPTFRSQVLGDMPSIGGNTAVVNATSGVATPTAFSMPSCSAASSALIWTTNTGFGCNSITGTGTVTSVATGTGLTGGPITTTGTISLANIAADNVLANSTGGSAAPIATPLGSCSAAQNALTYNTSSHAFGCNTISGSGTVIAATAGQIAYYPGTTNVVDGNPNANISSGTLTLGLASTTLGSLVLEGSTSGAVTLTPQAIAGTPTITFGTSSGTPVVTASAPLAITTATGNITVTGVAGQVLGGAGPAFTATPTLGAIGVATGQVKLAGTTSGVVTFSVADVSGTWTMKLPTSAGSAGQFLSTDGSGNAAWASPAGGGTVNAGLTGQITYYPGSAATVSGNANANISAGSLTLGQASSTLGQLILEGSTSGALTIAPQATAGTPTWTAGTASGTPAVTASAPLSITTATGNISITGQVALANGGTSANLSASNGGIFYSTASAGAILAGTATANQILLSGASTTPSWSTATYPATTTVNQLLYSSSNNTVVGLSTANNGVFITSGSGVPSVGSIGPTLSFNGTTLQAVNGCTIMWPTAALSGNWNVVDAYGNPVSTSGSNSSGLQEAITFSIANGQCLQVFGQGTLALGNQTGTTNTSNGIVTGLSNTANLLVGDYVVSPNGGIPLFTTIASVNSGTQVTLNHTPTAAGARSLTFTRPAGPNRQSFISMNIPGGLYIPPVEQWAAYFYDVNITCTSTVNGPCITFDSAIITDFQFLGGQIVYQPATPAGFACPVLIAPTNPVPLDGVVAFGTNKILISNIASPAGSAAGLGVVCFNIAGGSIVNNTFGFVELNGTGSGSTPNTSYGIYVQGATASTSFRENVFDVADIHLVSGSGILEGNNTTNQTSYGPNTYRVGGIRPGASAACVSTFGSGSKFYGVCSNEEAAGTLAQGINFQSGANNNYVHMSRVGTITTPLLDGGTGNVVEGNGGIIIGGKPVIPSGACPPAIAMISSGSGTFTTPTCSISNFTGTVSQLPAQLDVEFWGGGAGGSGGGTGGGAGTAGNNTTFGAFTAGGGAAAAGAGGNCTGSPTFAFSGGNGGVGGINGIISNGGAGGSAPHYGVTVQSILNAAGSGAPANTGTGGGGGGANTSTQPGAGGSGGAYCRNIYNAPASSYSYGVAAGAAGGSAGTSGFSGGAGGTGGIISTAKW